MKDLIGQGVLGIVCAILFYWLWKKDSANEALRDAHADTLRELHEKALADQKAETTARVADATNYTNLALKLQSEANAQVNRLTDVFEEVRRLVSERSGMGPRYEEDREERRARPTLQAPRAPSSRDEPAETTAQMPLAPRGRYGERR